MAGVPLDRERAAKATPGGGVFPRALFTAYGLGGQVRSAQMALLFLLLAVINSNAETPHLEHLDSDTNTDNHHHHHHHHPHHHRAPSSYRVAGYHHSQLTNPICGGLEYRKKLDICSDALPTDIHLGDITRNGGTPSPKETWHDVDKSKPPTCPFSRPGPWDWWEDDVEIDKRNDRCLQSDNRTKDRGSVTNNVQGINNTERSYVRGNITDERVVDCRKKGTKRQIVFNESDTSGDTTRRESSERFTISSEVAGDSIDQTQRSQYLGHSERHVLPDAADDRQSSQSHQGKDTVSNHSHGVKDNAPHHSHHERDNAPLTQADINRLLNSANRNCSGERDEGRAEFTIVTALFDLGRETWPSFRRGLEVYMAYSLPLLALNIPIVAFVSPQVVPFIRHFRHSKSHLTRVISLNLRDLRFAHVYGAHIERVMASPEFKRNNELLDHPEGFSADYNILMNAKVWLLNETAKHNPFNTNFFYWLDMGYGHGHDVYPESCEWSPTALLAELDRITYIAVNNVSKVESIYQLYKQQVGPGVNGGFFGGSSSAVNRYASLYTSVLEELLSRNIVDDDQTLAVECFLRRPDLFNMVRGGWYDVFRLFH